MNNLLIILLLFSWPRSKKFSLTTLPANCPTPFTSSPPSTCHSTQPTHAQHHPEQPLSCHLILRGHTERLFWLWSSRNFSLKRGFMLSFPLYWWWCFVCYIGLLYALCCYLGIKMSDKKKVRVCGIVGNGERSPIFCARAILVGNVRKIKEVMFARSSPKTEC